MRAPAPAWMVGAGPRGLLLAGPDRGVSIGLEAPAETLRALVRALADGTDAAHIAAITGAAADEAAELLETLAGHGALAADSAGRLVPGPGAPLVTALAEAYAKRPVPRVSWTAEEVLVLPERVDPRVARRALRAFVAGLQPQERLTAYAQVASTGVSAIAGDVPEAAALESALLRATESGDADIHAVSLSTGECHSVAPERLDNLGGHAAHRLGPVLLVTDPTPVGSDVLCSARHAVANLRHTDGSDERWTRGTAPQPRLANLIARAEAVERYALGDAAAVELVRAGAAELDNPIDPSALYLLNQRQGATRRAPPDDPPPLWTRGANPAGEPRWAPVDAVLMPLVDPALGVRSMQISSSGAAAHTDPAQACERALLELVERDAIMWTWIQRVSRERIDPDSLPDGVRARVARLRADGARVSLVNLTLDSAPVVLAVLRDGDRLVLGAASRRHAKDAAVKALQEAEGIRALGGLLERSPIAREQVRTPGDHLRLHQQPELQPTNEFLDASEEVVSAEDIPSVDGSVADAVAHIGEPCLVDLSSPATSPFAVVRALVPGMVPITFGFDAEPLGMPRLAQPIRDVDGRELGHVHAPGLDAPLIPHPFP